MTDDPARRHAPATLRNRDPITAVLRQVLPARGLVLEVASGTGEHCAHWAPMFPGLAFQPSDPQPEARASIAAWCADLPNVRPPLALDVLAQPWPLDRAAAVLCINMIHISPWASTPALLRGASRLLPAGGPLFLYGPFLQEGVPTADGNLAFDASLRAQNPDWGIRRLEVVTQEAAATGFGPPQVVPMPANNLSVIFRKV